jgi:hypothetical protein
MNAIKAALNMSNLSVPAKINRANFVLMALNGNPNYPGISGVLTSAQAAVDNLETAWKNAADGGKKLTALMHDAEAALMVEMSKVAHYVEDNGNSDPEKIHSAGLDLRIFKGQTIDANAYWVKNGKASGEIIVKIKAQLRTMYNWQYCLDPMATNAWIDMMSTHSRLHIENLTAGQKYWVRVCFIDKNGTHAFTNPISIIVI